MMGYKTENNGTAPEKYEEYKNQIIRSIKDWHCTLPQIKGFAGIRLSDDISEVLTYMIDQGEIVRLQNEKMTAYFLPEKLPSKFWLSGDGRTAVEFVEEKPKAEAAGKKEPNPNFTKENFYEWGQKNFSVVDIANELGIARQSVTSFLRWNPEMQEKFQAGKKAASELTELVETTDFAELTEVSAPEVSDTLDHPAEHFSPTEEDDAQWNSLSNPFPHSQPEELAQAKIPEVEIEPELSEISNQPDEPEVNVFEPVEEFIPCFPDDKVELPKPELANTPPHNTLEAPLKDWEQPVSHVQERILKADIRPFEPSVVISFADAGNIHLYADLNLFQMDAESREFVNQLINSIQAFKAKKAKA